MPYGLRYVLFAVLGMAGGAVLGIALGAAESGRMAAMLLGGAGGAALFAAREELRARRLLEWLRDPKKREPTREGPLWGELSYRAERALLKRDRALADERRRLQQFLTAIEASPNGVLLLDGSDQIQWCNRVAADHFGLDPQRDLQQRVTNLVRQPAFVAYLQGGDFDEPVTVSDPVTLRTITVLVRPYGAGQKLVLTQDVTDVERAEAMRRDFVANVSHEIRTPLTVLAGFVETMGSVALSEPERQRVLQLMTQQTTRMQALVADLLTLAQLEGSPRPPPDRWHDLSALLQRIQADAIALSAGRHHLSVSIDGHLEIAGSESELLSAIGNLVTNAIRYTPQDGRIEVVVRGRADGGVDIEVSDTGTGIAREHLSRLTERFYRVDSSRSRETGGTGLGLSIVKHVVQRHGGSIEIDSEPGRGSSFRLVFPAMRVRQGRVLAPATEPMLPS